MRSNKKLLRKMVEWLRDENEQDDDANAKVLTNDAGAKVLDNVTAKSNA